uniref:Uncharacterized protein n=1 Tax=uncultured bacterium ws406H10 TaxID=1131831 RepID=I1X5G7_9BACT|nr:hypothetical protein ws406H10_0030 [uncultured bacterium ws406H10]
MKFGGYVMASHNTVADNLRDYQKRESAMTLADIPALEGIPDSVSGHRLDFDHSEIIPGLIEGTCFLLVSGTKPWITLDVSLQPRVHISRPDYLGVEVVGLQKGQILPNPAPFALAIEITHIKGNKGIEVIGASATEFHDIGE